MDPVLIDQALQHWFGIAITVFTAVVTGSSILLRSIAAFIKNRQQYELSYLPSRGLIIFMAVLSALAQNSVTASNIIADAKRDVKP